MNKKRSLKNRNIIENTLSLSQRFHLDYKMIDLLMREFSLKQVDICDWTGLTRQRVEQILKSRPVHRTTHWIGHPLKKSDITALKKMASDILYPEEASKRVYRIYNNRHGKLIVLIQQGEDIRAYFLQELPDDVAETMRKNRMDVLSEAEQKAKNDVEYVTIRKEPHFRPLNRTSMYYLANKRGMTLADFGEFLTGCPIANKKDVTDDQIIAYMERNKKADGTVSFTDNNDGFFIRNYACRIKTPTADLIRFYGYKPGKNTQRKRKG